MNRSTRRLKGDVAGEKYQLQSGVSEGRQAACSVCALHQRIKWCVWRGGSPAQAAGCLTPAGSFSGGFLSPLTSWTGSLASECESGRSRRVLLWLLSKQSDVESCVSSHRLREAHGSSCS